MERISSIGIMAILAMAMVVATAWLVQPAQSRIACKLEEAGGGGCYGHGGGGGDDNIMPTAAADADQGSSSSSGWESEKKGGGGGSIISKGIVWGLGKINFSDLGGTAEKCLASIYNVRDCYDQFNRALNAQGPATVSTPCCYAVSSADCLLVYGLLKGWCAFN